jgi:hypothetical protein
MPVFFTYLLPVNRNVPVSPGIQMLTIGKERIDVGKMVPATENENSSADYESVKQFFIFVYTGKCFLMSLFRRVPVSREPVRDVPDLIC